MLFVKKKQNSAIVFRADLVGVEFFSHSARSCSHEVTCCDVSDILCVSDRSVANLTFTVARQSANSDRTASPEAPLGKRSYIF